MATLQADSHEHLNADGTSTSTIPGTVTAYEKIQKKNDLKARSILMMTLPSEHLLTFNQYKDAKTLFEAIEATFGSNEATKKTQGHSEADYETSMLLVVHEDLEKIHEDDLEEMDLKWQLALLSMKARKFYQRTKKKIIINGSDTAGYDKTKVECFNCHKMGHFARECKNPRSQENRSRNQDSSRRTVNVEESSSKAMLAIDGVGFDWSFMTEEKTPTNFALMAFSDSEEFKQPEFEGYEVKVKKNVSENSSNEIKKTSGAPIIEDWVSDCDEDETLENVSESANVQKPKQVGQPRKISQNPRNNSTNWNTPMSKKLGVGFQFTPKACFVCESFNHLIKDCDFHDKKMVQKPVLNNEKKGTVQREVRPSGLVPISAARQNSSRTSATVSAARPIKTAASKPFMNILEFCDKHNMVAYLVKSKSSEGFDEIIDFLTSSHIYYAFTENPIICVSLIEQFWETAVLSTTEEGLQAISATIDGHEKLINEASLRRHLKLEDAKGISSLSNEEIFEQLAHVGYVTNSESLTFFKGHFSPQWKFFIHTILHCLSPKKTAWDQFSSNIATAIISFIQLLLNKQQRLLLPHTRTYPTPTLTSKLFSNMRRASKGEPIQPTMRRGRYFTAHDSLSMLFTHMKSVEADKEDFLVFLTKVVLRVKKLEYKAESGKEGERQKIVLLMWMSELSGFFQTGRMISQIDEGIPTISLVPR
ncbi:ribonuclease H-like domain-containing protein [Tanacetum coccineum]